VNFLDADCLAGEDRAEVNLFATQTDPAAKEVGQILTLRGAWAALFFADAFSYCSRNAYESCRTCWRHPL
jgi:hypothetical protein